MGILTDASHLDDPAIRNLWSVFSKTTLCSVLGRGPGTRGVDD
jgi:hypothetical protein